MAATRTREGGGLMFEGHPFRDAPVRTLPSALIKPRMSRWASFAAIGGVAAIWNTICGWQLFVAIDSGLVRYIVFVSMFVMIGVVLLVAAVQALLAAFNPTVELLAHVEQPVLGEPFELHWRLTGKASRVRQLRIDLEGIEEATYTRGGDIVTDRHTFLNQTIATTNDRSEVAEGSATFVFPANVVPSFTSSNNKIVWRMVVRGEIQSWPDIHDIFPIDVVGNPRVRRKAAA